MSKAEDDIEKMDTNENSVRKCVSLCKNVKNISTLFVNMNERRKEKELTFFSSSHTHTHIHAFFCECVSACVPAFCLQLNFGGKTYF